jgi:multiple sugar transport system permease protein
MDGQATGSKARYGVWDIILSERYFKWVLVMPLIIVLALFLIYPVVWVIHISFFDYGGVKPPLFVGLDNYREVLVNQEFWRALGRTAQVLVTSIIIELVLGMGIAVLFNRNFKGQNFVRGFILLPLLMTPLAVSMMWYYFLQYDFGAVNLMLEKLGFSKVMWFSPNVALHAVTAISIWQWIPFSIFVLLAGLKSLPRDAFEAAKVDGAIAWYVFRRLTLPMLMPLIMIIVLLRTMWLIRLFDPLYATTRGACNTEVLDWLIYRNVFVLFDIGRGATLAIITLFFTFVVCALLFRQLMKAMGVNLSSQ